MEVNASGTERREEKAKGKMVETNIKQRIIYTKTRGIIAKEE